jgi:3-carboxy-cis,cis-muconate cycloisomerase
MQRNLDGSRGLVMSEALTVALARRVGADAARAAVEAAAAHVASHGDTLREALLRDAGSDALSSVELDDVFDPAMSLGSTPRFIDNALAAYHEAMGDRAG